VRKNLVLFGIFLFFLLPFFSLYPNPAPLIISVHRVFCPPVDSYFVGHIAEKFTGMTPGEIEEHIEIPYYYDWETYNLPWYFPTVEEAVAKGKGDCKTKMIIFSSVLEYHRLPYSISASLTHIWVDYEERKPRGNEGPELAMFSFGPGETPSIKTPQEIRGRASLKSFRRGFWDCMPIERKSLFLFSFGFSSLFFFPKYLEKHFQRR